MLKLNTKGKKETKKEKKSKGCLTMSVKSVGPTPTMMTDMGRELASTNNSTVLSTSLMTPSCTSQWRHDDITINSVTMAS
jgi:hypothetical protein